ncbi:hypothetical protein MNV49_003248 [Pseudohyphozyma bogoriensis]|nr:hypothetical protein MNV49_003248 [Pseudohyphozyma bogoriensis]
MYLDLPEHSIRMHYVSVPLIPFYHYPTLTPFNDARLTKAYNLYGRVIWRLQGAGLMGSADRISFDLYMHGKTTGADRDKVTIEDMAKYVDSALKKLDLESYFIVGENFMGSNVGSYLAIWNPDRVKALVFASPGWPKEPKAASDGMVLGWLPAACVNKDGKGDKSGTIPAEPLATGGPGGAQVRTVASAPHILLTTDPSISNRFILQFLSSNSEDDDRLSVVSDESDLSIASSSNADGPRAKRARTDKGKGKEKGGRDDGKDGAKKKKREVKGKGKAWEGQFQHTWSTVVEDASGSLSGVVSDVLLSSKTKRIVRDTTSIQRGIIRHVFLVLDLSSAMLVREYKSPWLDLALQYAREFVTEFFDQNPISQLSILITRDGGCERLSPLSGNPVDHLKALSSKKKLEARGEPSLQNCLEMARSGLAHLPPHGSREVIIILGSLTTCDPGNIHKVIDTVAKDRIRVNVIGLSAEMKVCKEIANRTKGTYIVALDDLYLRDSLFELIPPPPTLSVPSAVSGGPSSSSSSDLMLLGFPTLISPQYPGLCSCHSKLKSSGFGCPRCKSRLCEIPCVCGVCGITVVSGSHLARSFRFLFPVENYVPLPQIPASYLKPPQANCHACAFPFPTTRVGTGANEHLSPVGRYMCPKCEKEFCLDCDKLTREGLGFCVGCV